jgi:hypothetical protein
LAIPWSREWQVGRTPLRHSGLDGGRTLGSG